MLLTDRLLPLEVLSTRSTLLAREFVPAEADPGVARDAEYEPTGLPPKFRAASKLFRNTVARIFKSSASKSKMRRREASRSVGREGMLPRTARRMAHSSSSRESHRRTVAHTRSRRVGRWPMLSIPGETVTLIGAGSVPELIKLSGLLVERG